MRKHLCVVVVVVALSAAILIAATTYRLPTGNGATTAWTAQGAATAWEAVDDSPDGGADDDTSYIEIIGITGNHLFTYAAPSIPAGSTINSVSVFTRHRRAGSGSWTRFAALRVDSTTHLSSSGAISSTSYADQTSTFATNPATGAAWTLDQVNGVAGSDNLTEFGVRGAAGAGEEARVTQAYLIIDYTPSGGAPGPPPGSLNLLGAGR